MGYTCTCADGGQDTGTGFCLCGGSLIPTPTTVQEADALLAESNMLRQRADNILATITEAFPSMRATYKLSQSDMAAGMGSTQAYVSMVENKRRSATPMTVTKALGVLRSNAQNDLRQARRKGKQ